MRRCRFRVPGWQVRELASAMSCPGSICAGGPDVGARRNIQGIALGLDTEGLRDLLSLRVDSLRRRSFGRPRGHLINNETQLTRGLLKMLFLSCFPSPAGAGPACGCTEMGSTNLPEARSWRGGQQRNSNLAPNLPPGRLSLLGNQVGSWRLS